MSKFEIKRNKLIICISIVLIIFEFTFNSTCFALVENTKKTYDSKYTDGKSGVDLALYVYNEAHKDKGKWEVYTDYYVPVNMDYKEKGKFVWGKPADNFDEFMADEFFKSSNINDLYRKYSEKETENFQGEDLTTKNLIEEEGTNIIDKSNTIMYETSIEQEKNPTDNDPFAQFIDGLAGLLLYPIKVIPLLIGKALTIVMGAFANNADASLDVEDILFNKVALTDINFFDISEDVKSNDQTVYDIRVSVATWYYSVRNVAIVALLVICIYVGIRMAIATVAEERAKYKEMLIDWATGLALVFVLHYAMIFIININNALVDIFAKGLDSSSGNVMEKFYTQAWEIGFTNGFISAVCYLILVGITFVFLLAYIKRMITIGFLIVIAPLVTVTYSLDKMGDSRSQALNTWFKEFLYNILIQPFQCVAYLVLANTAFDLLDKSDSSNLGEMFRAAVIAIVMLVFILQTEKIIKHIFHFESETMADGLKEAAVGVTALTATKGMFSGGKSGGNGSGEDSGSGSAGDNEAKKYKSQNEIKTASENSSNINRGGTPEETRAVEEGSSQSRDTTAQRGNTRRGTQQQTSGAKPKQKGAFKRELANAVGNLGSNKIIRGYAKMAANVGAGMLGGALITGMTGDLKQGVVNGVQFGQAMNNSKGKLKTAATKQTHKNQLAKSYNNYANQYAELHKDENLTDQQINEAVRQHALDLMNENYDGELSAEDREFKESLENVFADGKGSTEKESYQNLNRTLTDIEEGKIGETTLQKSFKGQIKRKQKNKEKNKNNEDEEA